MTEANIYRLSKTLWGKAFPKLLENIIAKGNKIHILCQDQQILESLDDLLWTYEQLSFLPHATIQDQRPNDQPIILSTNTTTLNKANIVAIAGNILPDNISSFEKIIYMYEANDMVANDFLKDKLSHLEKSGIKINYFTQSAAGNWERT